LIISKKYVFVKSINDFFIILSKYCIKRNNKAKILLSKQNYKAERNSIMFDKENFKENLKANRAVYITAISILLAMILIVAAVVATNRNQQGTPNVTEKPGTTSTTPSTNKPSTNDPTQDVIGKLPTFSLPVAGKLSAVHDSELQVFSPSMNDYRVHLGIDLVTKENAPVYAAADGKISEIWVDPLMGYCIAISHSGNCVTVYKNLADTLPDGITKGASVRSGQLIATVGESAIVEVASEPHLHFEMTVGELAVDPLEYFDEASLESMKSDLSHE
jgi:murein DD-endopeptidase MepM/ murein hydrolase activator NlpD